MPVGDKGMRKRAHFYNKRDTAIAEAKQRHGVVIQVIRGRQWIVATGNATVRESLNRMCESTTYLGLPAPKIVKDFRR